MKFITTKITTFVMSALMVFAAYGMCVSASTIDEDLLDSITETYSAALKEAGVSSFHGNCNLATAYQLKVMGIYKNQLDCSERGNLWYSYFQNVSTTSGGYTVTTIGGADCLKTLINTYGDEIYNVVYSLGTGGTSGTAHVLYIRAIIDGYVYFSDSFACTYDGTYYAEGQGTALTVDKFISAYKSMNGNPYGLVYFTNGDATAVTASATNEDENEDSDGNYIVTASVLNVRSGGSTDDDVIGSLIYGTVVSVLTVDNNWGLIDYNSKDGWICLDWAEKIASDDEDEDDESTDGVIFLSADDGEMLLGDVDGNGRVSAADARIVLRIAAGLTESTELQSLCGDMDGDGKITLSDARFLIRYIAGLVEI